jgi:hypothetical protein
MGAGLDQIRWTGRLPAFDHGEFKNGHMHFTYESTSQTGDKIKGNFKFYFICRDSAGQYKDVTDENGKTLSVKEDLTCLRKNK